MSISYEERIPTPSAHTAVHPSTPTQSTIHSIPMKKPSDTSDISPLQLAHLTDAVAGKCTWVIALVTVPTGTRTSKKRELGFMKAHQRNKRMPVRRFIKRSARVGKNTLASVLRTTEVVTFHLVVAWFYGIVGNIEKVRAFMLRNDLVWTPIQIRKFIEEASQSVDRCDPLKLRGSVTYMPVEGKPLEQRITFVCIDWSTSLGSPQLRYCSFMKGLALANVRVCLPDRKDAEYVQI